MLAFMERMFTFWAVDEHSLFQVGWFYNDYDLVAKRLYISYPFHILMVLSPRNIAIMQGTRSAPPTDLMDSPVQEGPVIPVVSVTYCGWVREGRILLVERLIAGKPVDPRKRTVFPLSPEMLADSFPQEVPTGEYGFLDFAVREVFACERPESSPPSRVLPIPVIELYRVGIEPPYHHQGYGLQLVRRLGEIAEERGISALVSKESGDQNFPSLRSLDQLGFVERSRSFVQYVQGIGRTFHFYTPIPLVIPGLPELDRTIVLG